MLKDIKAVIFDLDGTLIDSMWLWKQIDIDYLQMKGYELPGDLQDDIEGMSFPETAGYFKERFGIEEEVETIMAVWNGMAKEHYLHKVPLKPHADRFLELLRLRGVKMGIGTSNSRELADAAVSRHRLHHYCQSIRTGCDVEKGKPHPDIFLKVAQDLQVDPAHCLVFEDIPNGIKAARNAGMKVCAVHDDFSRDLAQEKRRLADYFIDSYEELLDQLEGAAV